MSPIIAYCGLDCSTCEAYLATKANDEAAKARVAAQWCKEYGASLTAADIVCDGCTAVGRKIGHCSECSMRACGVAHKVTNCAHCAEYPCEKLAKFLNAVPAAKATLDEIRAAL